MSSEYEFSLSELANLPMGAPPFLIQYFVHAENLSILHGPPEAGKTYLAVLLALMAAGGGNWAGKFQTPKRPLRTCYVLTDGSKYDLGERIRYGMSLWPKSLLNFKAYVPPYIDLRSEASIQELIDITAGYDLIFLDSLTSMTSGDVTKAEHMAPAMHGIRKLKMAHPDRGIVLLHHDHRQKYTNTGEKINEGGNAFAGSYVIQAEADMMWHITRPNPGLSASASLEQSKSRSRFTKTDSFYVHLDPISGALTAEGAPDTVASKRIREWLRRVKEATTPEIHAWADSHKISRSTTFRYLRALVEDGVASRENRGHYKWEDK